MNTSLRIARTTWLIACVLVLLDACHSGDVTRDLVVPNEALAEALTREGRAGAVVFAAAKGRQESIERSAAGLAALRGVRLATDAATRLPTIGTEASVGHGVFTAALLAALHDPSTDADNDGVLQLSEVVSEVTRRVTLATRGDRRRSCLTTSCSATGA